MAMAFGLLSLRGFHYATTGATFVSIEDTSVSGRWRNGFGPKDGRLFVGAAVPFLAQLWSGCGPFPLGCQV